MNFTTAEMSAFKSRNRNIFYHYIAEVRLSCVFVAVTLNDTVKWVVLVLSHVSRHHIQAGNRYNLFPTHTSQHAPLKENRDIPSVSLVGQQDFWLTVQQETSMGK